MSLSRVLIANTSLEMEDIQKILFTGMEVRKHEDHNMVFDVDGLRCIIFYPIAPEFKHLALLEYPENLEVSFKFGSQIKEFRTAMKIVMNWFTHTECDSMFVVGSEYVLLSRINGHVVRTNSEGVDFPDEVIDLINIPHEIKNLGTL